jgi:ABC-type glycerol-3-phosphate transport system substrate-binding protein
MKAERSALWYVTTCTLLLGMALSAASLAAPKDVQFVVYSSEERVPLYQENFDAFKAKTGIGVEHQQVPGSQVQKWEQVITRIAGGLSPDVIGAVSVEFVQYAANGLILPVDEWIKKDKVNTRAIIPILVDALQWRGQQYMMPYGASGLPLVYNAQLFDEAGAAYPPEVWGKREWNWETFVSTLRKLTKKDSSGNITQYGLGGPPWDSWITLPYTWGGDWIDSEMKRFTGTSPETLASLQAMQDLRWNFQVMGTGGGLLEGRSAMVGWGTWNLKSMINSPLPLRMAPWFTVGTHPPKGPINPMGLAILASSQNKEAAWEFVKFSTVDPTGNYMLANAAGALPGTPQAYRRWQESLQAQKADLNPIAFVQQVAEHGGVVSIRKTTTFNDINAVMTPAVNSVINNTKSPTQAMEEAAPVVQALIDHSAH